MNYLGALEELYFKNYIDIAVHLGLAIRDDNVAKLKEIIQQYFNTPEARPLFEGEIAYLAEAGEDGSFLSPAAIAIITSSRSCLEEILAFTGNPNARLSPAAGEKSRTLLMEAAANGDYEAVKYLLESGARPDDIFNSGSLRLSALGYATVRGFKKILALLIDHNGKATVGDLFTVIKHSKPLSSIHSALLASNPEIVNQPVTEGDDITLLHGTAFEGDIDATRWLLSHGANIHATTADGATPFDFAIAADKSDVIIYLRSQGGERENLAGSSNLAPGKIEITEIIERFEILEEKFGVSLNALYAVIEHRIWLTPPEFQIWINFDLTANSEGRLKDSFFLKATAYNDSGQSIGIASAYIYADDFLGFDSREILLSTQEKPAKIRLFPTK